MKVKLAVIAAVVAATSIGGVVMAQKDDSKPVTRNNAIQELKTPETAPNEATEPVSAPAEEPQTAPEAPSAPQTTTTPTSTTPAPAPTTPPAPTPAPFNARTYAAELLANRQAQGYATNTRCFNLLVEESAGWEISKDQVDGIFNKAFGQYGDSCAAYATFRQTGQF